MQILGTKFPNLGVEIELQLDYNFDNSTLRQYFDSVPDIMLCNNSVKEYKIMTENEIKLLEVIRNSTDPKKAILTAIEIILEFLEQPQSFE
jgi:hypothetical protein